MRLLGQLKCVQCYLPFVLTFAAYLLPRGLATTLINNARYKLAVLHADNNVALIIICVINSIQYDAKTNSRCNKILNYS